MEYDFRKIENRWRRYWKENGAYRVDIDPSKPKCYVLDMFPYPSGTGLHVGHPLGYITSDIYARYKRSKGFNVLHPMGYDSFGLPAEQYAIETGTHPAITTENNIATFREQLDKMGMSYDWSRELRTSDPSYYRWTQWIFLQLFKSWYNPETNRAEPIATLIPKLDGFERLSEKEQSDLLMSYRLAYCGYGEVNWCEALGTVLANDEVVNGVSERGGFPVVKKKLRQWYLRITAYADRLLEGLERIGFSDAMKEMQSNWIGKSSGAEIDFRVATGAQSPSPQTQGSTPSTKGSPPTIQESPLLRVYTTRPDTIFGVDFMVIAPEHELVRRITTSGQAKQVEDYLDYVQSRSERERMAEKKISGVFTGAYAINPFDGREIPIWISEYVLAGYGTGAIMAVPCGDERDHRFATHFNIPITNIIGSYYDGKEANPTKDAILENSGFLNGIKMSEAIDVAIRKIEEAGIGKRKVNYKIHDAAFSRQRYWGEPIPITWKPAGPGKPANEGIAIALDESELPLELPRVESYSPGPDGEGPLANIPEWTSANLETNTMPGYAGSSWYFLRYMDPGNDAEFCNREKSDYWRQVDLYVGGTEHAVGHLLYSRMWTKVLYDLGHIGFDEPFAKLLNQGMIQGSSRFVYRVSISRAEGSGDGGDAAFREISDPLFISHGYIADFERMNTDEQVEFIRKHAPSWSGLAAIEKDKGFLVLSYNKLHVDVNLVEGLTLDVEELKKKKPEYRDASFILEEGKYICGAEVEKMSKSKYNTVNPDVLVEKYGADTFRMYEMFLGPIEMSKPWDTKGIEGVHRFLKKLWRLFFDEVKGKIWTDAQPSDAELKILHRTIKKIGEDNERFSFNTGVSTFMICVNDLTDIKCHKKAILEKLLVLLSPYAPHISEELWYALGNEGLVIDAPYPVLEQKYLEEFSFNYPITINGKKRAEMELSLGLSQQEVEQAVLANDIVQKWLEGKKPDKIIFVKGRMINLVVRGGS